MPSKNKPIKRYEALKPVSREHHHGLLLCWKIKMGLRYEVDPNRIKEYVDWFYEDHITPHFEFEEKHIFPILGQDHTFIQRALAEHRKLREMFSIPKPSATMLKALSTTLNDHIRFEERVLFNEIQEVASTEQLDMLEKHHHEVDFVERTTDHFWEKSKG